MAYRMITDKDITIQYTLLDFIGTPTFEDIDLRTPEGKKRYKELFEHKSRNKSYKSQQQSLRPLRDIDFLFSLYNERDRRLFAGFLAKTIGFGGVQKAAKLTGLDEKTVRRGKKELVERANVDNSRIRRKDGKSSS